MLSTTSGLALRSPSHVLRVRTVCSVTRESTPGCKVTGIWNCSRSERGRKSYGIDASTVTAPASARVMVPMNNSLWSRSVVITVR